MKTPFWTPGPDEIPDAQRANGFLRSQIVFFALVPWVVLCHLALLVYWVSRGDALSEVWPAAALGLFYVLLIWVRVRWVRKKFGSLLR